MLAIVARAGPTLSSLARGSRRRAALGSPHPPFGHLLPRCGRRKACPAAPALF